jgi:hypothetical protein
MNSNKVVVGVSFAMIALLSQWRVNPAYTETLGELAFSTILGSAIDLNVLLIDGCPMELWSENKGCYAYFSIPKAKRQEYRPKLIADVKRFKLALANEKDPSKRDAMLGMRNDPRLNLFWYQDYQKRPNS